MFFCNFTSLIISTAFFNCLSQHIYHMVSSRRKDAFAEILEGGTLIYSDYFFKEKSLIPLSK